MSRPEFPHCVLPSNCISRIRQEQEHYDADPARAEREQAGRAEQAVLAEEMERQQYEQMLEAQEREQESEKLCECRLPGFDVSNPDICPTCKKPHRPEEEIHFY